MPAISTLERAAAIAHSQTAAYQRKLVVSNNIIREGLALAPESYVSFSGGKDSAVVLHLVSQIQDSTKAIMSVGAETAIISNFMQIIEDWLTRFSHIEVEIIEALRESLSDRYAKYTGRNFKGNGYFVGLRAEESQERRRTLKVHGVVHSNSNGLVRICPVAWWTTVDIKTYTILHDLPLLDNYTHSGFDERTTTCVPCFDRVRPYFLAELKARDFSGYVKLLELYPDLRQHT